MRIMKTGWGLVFLVVLCAILTFTYSRFNFSTSASQQGTRRLYEVATNSELSRADRLKAVGELAKAGTQEASDLLVAIAIDSQSDVDVRREAILSIGKRKDSHNAAEIATILRPHQPLYLRLATVETLAALECTETCMERVLHYMERIWRGEASAESHKEMDIPQKVLLDSDLEGLNLSLRKVLNRDRGYTIKALVDVYGLYSPYPSSFAIHLLEEVQLVEACEGLSRALYPPLLDQKGLAEVRRVASSLGCAQPNLPNL
jgi:hypothetical protein